MLLLRCTQSVFKKFGYKPQTVDVDKEHTPLGEWFIHTIDWLNHGDELMLCMHADSRYCLLLQIPDPLDTIGLLHAFAGRLMMRLIELETPAELAKKIVLGFDSAIFAKTNSRQVLGCMNSALADFERLLEIAPQRLTIDSKTLSLPKIEHMMNYRPVTFAKSYIYPLEEFWQSIRQIKPSLPNRQPLAIFADDSKELITEFLSQKLTAHLTSKLIASASDVSILYTHQEITTIHQALKEFDADDPSAPYPLRDLYRQTKVRLKRMEG